MSTQVSPPGPRATPGVRRAGVAALVVLGSLVCVGLGWWQYTRHEAKAESAAIVEVNAHAAPVDLAALVPPGDQERLAAGDAWRPVTLRGQWVPGSEVLLRNRPVDGQNAVRALALLRLEAPDGRAVLVERGWVPAGEVDDERAVAALALTSGPVELTGRLRPAEEPARRDAPAGQVYAASPVEIAGGGADVVPGTYVSRLSQSPAPTAALGGLPEPSTDLGSHLSYAFQWWVFALGLPIAVIVLVRRGNAQGGPATAAPRTDGPAPRRARRTSMEEEEDALLDAQERDQQDARTPQDTQIAQAREISSA